MTKLNDTAFPIHDLLRRRWSPRAFSERAVEPEKLKQLIEAARWSSSSFNAQPWRFIIATKEKPAEYGRMLACLMEKNQAWAKAAPVLMIGCAALNFSHNGKPNRHALYDLGQSVASLVFQATALDLYVHQMAGFNPDKARETYGIPADAEAVVALALGYLGDAGALSEELRQRETSPGVRNDIASIAFAGAWGRPIK